METNKLPVRQQITGLIANVLMSRTALLQQLIDPRRNLDGECGYPVNPDAKFYRQMYNRGDIAARVVDLWPDECWSVYPVLFESEDENEETEFEKAWKELSDRLNPWYYLHRVDELSGIGRYGALLFGFDDSTDLSTPVPGIDPITGLIPENAPPGERKLNFLRCFDESMVEIAEYEKDMFSPRYGLPSFYNLYLVDLNATAQVTQVEFKVQPTRVHHSRILHVADNRKNSETHGIPRQEPVINRLCDLRKILGSSGEMFYRGAFAGHAFEVLPELIALGMVEVDEESLRDQYEDYSNGLKRFMALNGMKATSLAPQVADPTQHVEKQIMAICIALKVPLRVFMGSEAAHLASTQDSGTWNRRLARRQVMYLNPMLIRPFVDRLIAVGVLPKPKQYRIEWTDLNAMSDKDKADVALKKSQALLQYVTSGAETMIAPLDYLVHIMGFDQQTAIQILESGEENADDRVTEDIWNKPEPEPFGGGGSNGSFQKSLGRVPRNSLGKGKALGKGKGPPVR